MSKVYTVREISAYIRNMFTQDLLLNRVTVRGEVSNAKDHPSGHLYFTLKDEGAQIQVVMFSGRRLAGLKCRLKDGMQAEVSGEIGTYEAGGRYQLYAREIREAGVGALYQRFLELKARLGEMGMFDEAYKKPIPKYVRTVGIVTASSGAALHDIVSIAARRNPYVQLILRPAQVQGEAAAASIAEAIVALDRIGTDVMIVGRGGGSEEDLFAFNDEMVARAIFDADTPVISAVGHETDFTIADFVADLRAPTPSAAAELAVFPVTEAEDLLTGMRERMTRVLTAKTELLKGNAEALRLKLKLLSPAAVLNEKKQRLLDLSEQMELQMERNFTEKRQRFLLLSSRLDALSPLARLSGGFVYAEKEDGAPLRSTEETGPGSMIRLRLHDGTVHSRVTKVEKDV